MNRRTVHLASTPGHSYLVSHNDVQAPECIVGDRVDGLAYIFRNIHGHFP